MACLFGRIRIHSQSTHTYLKILVTSTPPTHAIKKAELAAIDLGLKLGHHALLSDSACSLRLTHKYIRSPHIMQQHPHREILSYILSPLQTRTTTGLTTHLGKLNAHNNSKGNNAIVDHVANTVADGQRPDAINFRGARTHIEQWTWPYTTQPDEPNPPKILI
jgi:hypothetical protein